MKRRCCYIESLFLAGIICLSACGSKNPGVSKEELKKEVEELRNIVKKLSEGKLDRKSVV